MSRSTNQGFPDWCTQNETNGVGRPWHLSTWGPRKGPPRDVKTRRSENTMAYTSGNLGRGYLGSEFLLDSNGGEEDLKRSEYLSSVKTWRGTWVSKHPET